jgi:hypothetical protein
MTTVESPALARDHHRRTSPMWQVQAELLKLRSTRLWWLYLVGVVVITGWSLVRNGASYHYELYPPLNQYPADERAQTAAQAVIAHTPAGQAAIAADMVTSGQTLGVLLAMLLGILIVTNEYAHQTATATFLTNPHRGAVVAAKFVAAVTAGALFWAGSTAISLVATPFYLHSQQLTVAVTDWVPVRSVLLNALAYVMWAALGVGLGSLFRSQVSAVVSGMLVYVGGAAAVEVIFNVIYYAYPHTWVLGAPVIAPAVASLVMTTPGLAFDHAPPQWAGLLVMIGYVALFTVVGVGRARHQDV